MTYTFSPLTITLLSILLLGFLLAYFLNKKRSSWVNLSFTDLLKKITLRLKEWGKKTINILAGSEAVQSAKIFEDNIILDHQEKSIHVDISGDIPKGTTVQITLKVLDEQKKTIPQKKTLTHKVTSKSKSEKSSKAKRGSLVKSNTKYGQKKVITINTPDNESQASISNIFKNVLSRTIHRGLHPENAGGVLLAGAIFIYAFVVSFHIDRFPIYFFTDEAIHMNLASDFIRDNYQNYDHEFLPTFFVVEGWVNGTSVYVQVLPYLLFGKSIIVTRLVSAFITLLAALALGLLLKQIFKIKYYWAGVFLLLTTPAWFLHARTAFEYAEVGSFYMIFLYFYSRYRDGDMPSLYAALIAGALTFYTHGLGQVLMTITGTALFITDFKYHIHPNRRKTVLYGLVLGFILLLPFVRFYLAHASEAAAQIKRRGSYWYDGELTTPQKLVEFISQYAYGLNPMYWYLNNSKDIVRHVMKNYGNGLLITFPFALYGFYILLKNLRQFPYRIILISFLAAPLPSSIVAIGMPRMLWMSIPIAIITTLGLSFCLEKLESKWNRLSARLPWIVFIVLTSLSVFMLRQALVNGPIWFDDYTLYGMQFGAKQVFADSIVPELKNNPNINFVISPSWANGTEQFADFFIPKSLRSHVSFGQPNDKVENPSSINSDMRFVVTANEYDELLKNPKFKEINITKTIQYPNGKPGFYFLSVTPSDNIVEILAAEKTINRTPIMNTIQLDGLDVNILHSPFDSGDLSSVFDNNPDTLARAIEANPVIFDIFPTQPLTTQSVVIQTGSLSDFSISVSLFAPDATTPEIYRKDFTGLPDDPVVTINFDKGPTKSVRIYIEIKDNISGETSKIHVRTINFK